MLGSIARGLRLSLDERDHLFRLAGHNPPPREAGTERISPGLLRIFERLNDTPAEIVTELGETLRQTPLSVALTGDHTAYTGPARSIVYRWFTDPATRQLYAPDDHLLLTRTFVSGLRRVATLRGPRSRSAQLTELLLACSEEFREVWNRHEVGIRPNDVKRFIHPELGTIELACQTLVDSDLSHLLLVYTAIPGSQSHDKLKLLAGVGNPALRPETAVRSDSADRQLRVRGSSSHAPHRHHPTHL
jgi:hypothetical protein